MARQHTILDERPVAAGRRRRRGSAPAAARILRTITHGRWLPLTIVVLATAVALASLGFWQWGRLIGRRAANEAIARQLAAPPLALTAENAAGLDPADLTFRRVTVRGRWDYANEVSIRFRSLDGQAGVQVLTPLRVAGGERAVLVDRGWIPYQFAEPERRRQFQAAGEGEIEITGLVQQSQTKGPPAVVGGQDPGRADAWQRVDLTNLQRQLPYPLLPFWIERLPAPGEATALPRAKGLPEQGDGPHLSYALQWWAFTAILIVGYLAAANGASRRQHPRRPRPSHRRPPGT